MPRWYSESELSGGRPEESWSSNMNSLNWLRLIYFLRVDRQLPPPVALFHAILKHIFVIDWMGSLECDKCLVIYRSDTNFMGLHFILKVLLNSQSW